MTVPHYFQSNEHTCGAACLRMLLAAFGQDYDEATIAAYCGVTPLGSTIQDLVAGARSLGVNADLLAVFDETAAIAALSTLAPFVAMIELSNLYGTGAILLFHFVVPIGLDQDEVIFHEPADGPDRRAKLGDFLSGWATAGYRGMRIWTP